MTVAADSYRRDYAGNGVTKVYAVDFYFLQDAHLGVYVSDPGMPVVKLALGTDYTVIGAGLPAGGSVVFMQAPPAGRSIHILLEMPFGQPYHYVENDEFPAASHESALDNLALQILRQQTEIDRAVKVPISSSLTGDAILEQIFVAQNQAEAAAADAGAAAAAACECRDGAKESIASGIAEIGQITAGGLAEIGQITANGIAGIGQTTADGILKIEQSASEQADKLSNLVAYETGAFPRRDVWIVASDVPAGSVYALPELYFYGTDSLLLFYDNVPCTPLKAGVAASGKYQYEEMPGTGETSNNIRVNFPLEAGVVMEMICLPINVINLGNGGNGGNGGSNEVPEFSVTISATNPGPVITTTPYIVGSTNRANKLFVYLSGSYCERGKDYNEVGAEGDTSSSIEFTDALQEGEIINGFTG